MKRHVSVLLAMTVSAILTIVMAEGCSASHSHSHDTQEGSGSMAMPQTNQCEYIGRVASIDPIGPVHSIGQEMWKIEIEVVSVSSADKNRAPTIGARLTFFVHSVVRTFGDGESKVLGKSYRIACGSASTNNGVNPLRILGSAVTK
jgi:hypothetical protein